MPAHRIGPYGSAEGNGVMRKLPKALIPIFGITFVGILGFTILIPLLPYLAKRYGASDAVVGTLLTTTAVCATLSSPLWGLLSDRFGRKRALLGSQICSFAGYLLLALSGNLTLIFVSRAIEGFGGGNLGIAQSYVADVTSEEQRPLAFAYGAAAFGGGFIVGPILGGGLAHFGLPVCFFFAAGLQALNVVLTLTLLPESHQKQTATNVGQLTTMLKDPMLGSLMLRTFLYIFAYTYLFTTLSLYLSHLDNAGPEQSSIVLAFAGLVGALVTIFGVDRLVSRFGLERLIAAAFAAGALAYAALGAVRNIIELVPVLFAWAASGAVLRPTLNALLARFAPEEERGLVLGFSDALGNFALIFAPAVGGAIVGWNYRFSGVVPALALAAGFAIGARGTQPQPRA